MSITTLPRYLCLPLHREEVLCLERHPELAADTMGMLYSDDTASSYTRGMLVVLPDEALGYANLLLNAAKARVGEPGIAETRLRTPESILRFLARRLQADYIGYRASEILGDVTKGGEWLHNEPLDAFDGYTAYTLVVDEERPGDVLNYLISIGNGVAG